MQLHRIADKFFLNIKSIYAGRRKNKFFRTILFGANIFIQSTVANADSLDLGGMSSSNHEIGTASDWSTPSAGTIVGVLGAELGPALPGILGALGGVGEGGDLGSTITSSSIRALNQTLTRGILASGATDLNTSLSSMGQAIVKVGTAIGGLNGVVNGVSIAATAGLVGGSATKTASGPSSSTLEKTPSITYGGSSGPTFTDNGKEATFRGKTYKLERSIHF